MTTRSLPEAASTDTPGDARATDLLWVDVGEMLHLTVAEMRDLRSTFGEVLGLGSKRKIPRPLVPVIDYIVKERRDGTPDSEIAQSLEMSKDNRSWPEEILARMEVASLRTASAPPAETPAVHPEGTVSHPAQAGGLTETIAALFPEQPSFEDEEDLPVREMILELRREFQRHVSAERQDILRLNEALRRLSLEVRDLRYALLLAFSRKDRKKGKKGISNLLLG